MEKFHCDETPEHAEEESDRHNDEDNLRELEAIPNDQHPREVSAIMSDVIGLYGVLLDKLLKSHLYVIVLDEVDHRRDVDELYADVESHNLKDIESLLVSSKIYQVKWQTWYKV